MTEQQVRDGSFIWWKRLKLREGPDRLTHVPDDMAEPEMVLKKMTPGVEAGRPDSL